MPYSTTKAIVNKVLPGTFLQGLGRTYGVRGLGGALGTGVSLSPNAMLGLALGSVGMVLWLKHNGKLKSITA